MITRHLPTAAAAAVAALAACTTLLAASPAHAGDPTKEQCASANESAQAQRRAGKLRAARAQLLVCVAKACPQMIRDDCAQRLDDLEAAIPTIVFSAKGSANVDVTSVKVTMDGAPLAERLDGTALPVDPGTHTFELTAEGYPPVSTTLLVREGAKRRQEAITFGSTKPAAPVTPAPPPERAGPAPTPAPPERAGPAPDGAGDGQRMVAYVLGGIGVVGLGLGTYFGLRANSTYNDASRHCPTSSSCDDEGVSGGKDAHTQATNATIAFIAGGVLLAGGIVLFVTAPKHGGVSVQASAAPGAAGLRLGGTF